MNQKPVLVVMAAGMGSRYGGLKQIDPVGSRGEAILDYSLYDAYRAGFRTAVIIIKEAIREEFMASVGRRLEGCPMQVRYVYQELEKLPEGVAIPEGRVKPWGTGHAVLCAGEAIGGAPFAVINADDYYGRSAFQAVYDRLCSARDGERYDYCMVGYALEKTVTDHGSVSRGVCSVDASGCLAKIDERKRIEKYPGGIRYTEDGENWHELPALTTVSMNLWGFTPSILEELERRFPAFLAKTVADDPLKGEFLLPMVVDGLVQEGKARVEVLTSHDQWFGVTYLEDRPHVQAAIARMTREGKYPDGLWK